MDRLCKQSLAGWKLANLFRHWQRRALPWVLAATTLTAGIAGCTRPFYRNRADKEVEELLREKDVDPTWKIEQFSVYPPPQSRFAEFGNPDFPPMPPDDPAAEALAPKPQRAGKSGVGLMEGTGYLDLLTRWDLENRRDDAEKDAAREKDVALLASRPGSLYAPGETEYPDPLSSRELPRPFRVRVEQAVELGLINSREFQDRREDLYLLALPVTTERFAFSSQFFATEQLIRERLGRQFANGPANRFVSNSSVGFSKFFATGALLLFQFANRTVIELANPLSKHTISQSTISLDFVQPLLQGAGKAVNLEPLTLAERNLLYEVRDYARFRKQYYVNIVAGGDVGVISVGATRFRVRPTTFFSAANLIIGADVRPGRGNVVGIPVSGQATPSGFLPTLQNAALLENEQKNVTALEGFLRLFRAFEEGGDVSQLQVDRIEQQLLQSRNVAYQRDQTLRDTLDRLKLQLGVPANLPLELDDTPVESQRDQLRRFENILSDFDAVREAAANPNPQRTGYELRVVLRDLSINSPLVRDTRFRTDFPRRWDAWSRLTMPELTMRLSDFRAELRRLLASRDELEAQARPIPETLVNRIAYVRYEIDLARFEEALRNAEGLPIGRLADVIAVGAGGNPLPVLVTGMAQQSLTGRGLRDASIRDVVNTFEVLLLQARNERLTSARSRWPDLPRVCVNNYDLMRDDLDDAENAVAQAALNNRLDLMNLRAQLVDAWRQIRVAANFLLGTFNVEYHLHSVTPPGLAQPLAFSGSRSRHQLILNTELPLVRIVERNNYRASLIGWQRQRRSLMAAEDTIVAGVRSQLRQLRVLATTYKIQQRAVELAYLQVENSLDTFRAPPIPGQQGGGANTSGNAAALTQQLLQSQADLNRAQNNLINIWVQYLTTRMQLYRDLELMQFDSRGVWIDDVATCQCPPDGIQPPANRPKESGASDQ